MLKFVCRDTVEVKAGHHRQILQPLPRPPVRQKQHHAIAKDSQPAALLIADIGSTESLSQSAISSLEDAELFCAISLTNAASTSQTGAALIICTKAMLGQQRLFSPAGEVGQAFIGCKAF